MVTGANRQLHRQSSQNPNDTIRSHIDQNLSNSTTRPLDPVNQIAIALEKLEKRTRIHYCFTQKQPPSLPHPFKKQWWGAQWINPLNPTQNMSIKLPNKHMIMI